MRWLTGSSRASDRPLHIRRCRRRRSPRSPGRSAAARRRPSGGWRRCARRRTGPLKNPATPIGRTQAFGGFGRTAETVCSAKRSAEGGLACAELLDAAALRPPRGSGISGSLPLRAYAASGSPGARGAGRGIRDGSLSQRDASESALTIGRPAPAVVAEMCRAFWARGAAGALLSGQRARARTRPEHKEKKKNQQGTDVLVPCPSISS